MRFIAAAIAFAVFTSAAPVAKPSGMFKNG
jgi:hypothetical protein